jgi:hypothetical protein
MQPQFAAFVGTITQGDLPIEGMASLYVEMAPGNWVFRVVDYAVKATNAKPGAQIVERQYGTFEVHSMEQEDVLNAGNVVLRELGVTIASRKKPEIASMQIINNVNPYQAQLLNRFNKGMMLIPRQTMLVLECTPAAYINFAANEAEKASDISIMHVSSIGVFGRLWLCGTEANVLAARDAAVAALEAVDGKT